MLPLLSLLRTYWLPLLLAALALLALAQGRGAFDAWQHRKAGAQTEARVVHRQATKAGSDSAYYFDAGRRYEITRQLDQLANHAESLAPAAALPVLPAAPPRQ